MLTKFISSKSMKSQLSKVVSTILVRYLIILLKKFEFFHKNQYFPKPWKKWKYGENSKFHKIYLKNHMKMLDTDLKSWDVILFNKKILVNTCWLFESIFSLWNYPKIIKKWQFLIFHLILESTKVNKCWPIFFCWKVWHLSFLNPCWALF